MGDNDQELRLNFAADLSQLESASHSLRQYIQNTVDAVKAVGDFNAVELQMASSAGIVHEAIRDSFSGDVSTRLSELTGKTEDWNGELKAVRDSVIGIKSEIEDPTLQEAIGGASGGGGGRGLGKRDIGDVAQIVGLASPEAAGAIRIGGDIAELTKNSDKFKEALGGLNPGLIAGGVAAAGLTAALVILHNNFEQGKADALADLSARQRALTLIQTSTTEEIQAREKVLETQRTTNLAIANDANKVLLDLRVGIRDTFGEAGATLAEINSTLGTAAPELAAAKKNAEDASKALEGTNTELELLKQYSSSGASTTADLAQKEKDLTAARLKEIDVMVAMGGVVVANEEQIAQLRRTGSAEELANLKQKIQDEIAANTDVMNQFAMKQRQYATDSAEYKKLQDVVDGYSNKLVQLRQTLTSLDDPTLAAQTTLNDAAKEQQKVMESSAASYEKYLNDISKANTTFYTAELAAHDSYMGKVADINAAAAKQVAEELEKLTEKRADLNTKLLQTEQDDALKLHQTQLDDQIKYQRDIERLTETHQNTIKQILKDAANQQQELIMNRDFLGLYNLNRTTDQKVQAENDQYAQQRQNLLTNLQQQTDDENRHFAEQEAQRLVEYNRQLAEAQLQYNRQSVVDARNRTDALNKAQSAYTDQLNLLSQKHTQELQMLRNNEVQSLQMISQGASQKLQLEAQYYAASLALVRNATQQIGSIGAGLRGVGGQGFSGSVSVTQNITGGGDAATIAKIAAQQSQKTLEQFFTP